MGGKEGLFNKQCLLNWTSVQKGKKKRNINPTSNNIQTEKNLLKENIKENCCDLGMETGKGNDNPF